MTWFFPNLLFSPKKVNPCTYHSVHEHLDGYGKKPIFWFCSSILHAWILVSLPFSLLFFHIKFQFVHFFAIVHIFMLLTILVILWPMFFWDCAAHNRIQASSWCHPSAYYGGISLKANTSVYISQYNCLLQDRIILIQLLVSCCLCIFFSLIIYQCVFV